MMQKEAEPQNLEANAAKIKMNTQVAQLLHLDEDTLKAKSKELADAIKRASEGSPRILVTGGAGSGKTTIARILSTLFVVKNLDLDEYIPGGWTSDSREYARRFSKGLYELWEDVPRKKGWVIEHVEACNSLLTGLYRPDFAVLVDPGEERLREASEARSAVMGANDSKDRLARALQSDKIAKTQFNSLPGEVILKIPGFLLKKIDN